jgi:hypothetical protein
VIRTYIDGTEVTATVLGGSSKHTLGKPWQANVSLPIDYAATDLIGKLLKVVGDAGEFPLAIDDIDHHGRILDVSDNDDENTGTTEVTSYGPDEIWQWRPARDGPASADPGDFSKPEFMQTLAIDGGGPVMEDILAQSEDGFDPSIGEGPMLIEFGSFATGGADLSGAPTNWPMTIAQIRSILQDSGECDVIVTPIDSGGNIGRVDVYNGNYGTDRSGSVRFDYATGLNNVGRIRRTQNMQKMVNKLWYYLGPKIDDQHWQGNITADGYPDGSGGALPLPNPPGGDQTPITGPLGQIIADSRVANLVRMDIRIYDAFNAEAIAAALYARLWQTESLLRAQFRELVHITPIRGVVPAFDIGDIIGVSAGAAFRGGIPFGGQRVYDRTVSWNREGVVELAEIQTSADQEAAD